MSILTVLGPIAPENLGIALTHDHLYHGARLNFRQDPRVGLRDKDVTCLELQEFKERGGNAVFEMTPIDCGRDPAVLQEISRRSGIHVIMATGYYYELSFPDFVRRAEPEEIADQFVRELTVGVGDTGIRAGLIGELGTGERISANEEKVFRAGALAQQRTGAPILTHTYWGELGLEQAALLRDAGADMCRVVIGHVDSKVDFAYHKAIADSGAFVGFDCVGKCHYDRYFDRQFPSDADRADMVMRMVRAGYAKQLLLSCDIGSTHYLRCNGGWGYAIILREFVPLLREHGLDEETLHTILVENPRRLLTG